MLGPGTTAPDFTLPDQNGTPTSLGDLVAGGPLLLCFYPADFTPICTREACMLRDIHAELRSAGLTVAGISPDAPAKHARFVDRHKLPYTLLADTDRAVTALYEARGRLGFGVRRISYLIDRNGIIGAALLASLRVSRHKAFVKKALAHEIALEASSARPQV